MKISEKNDVKMGLNNVLLTLASASFSIVICLSLTQFQIILNTIPNHNSPIHKKKLGV